MAIDRVRYHEDEGSIEIVGKGDLGFHGDLETWVAPLELLESASSKQLSDALVAASADRLEVSPVTVEEFAREDYPPMLDLKIEPGPEGVVISRTFPISDEAGPDKEGLGRLLAPQLVRESLWMSLDTLEFPDLFVYPPVRWGVTVSIGSRKARRSVGDVLRAAREAFALIEVVRGGRDFGAHEAAQLVRGGHGTLLLGQAEAEWIEAKSGGYQLDEPLAQHELAKDTSAFANGTGGLILIGFRTRRISGVDTIYRETPVPRGMIDVGRYRRTLDRLVYPAIEGLTIETVSTIGANCFLLIEVPPQNEALKPFLVIGSLIGDRVASNYLALYRRRGEDVVATSSAEIHSLLLVGRLALGGQAAGGDR